MFFRIPLAGLCLVAIVSTLDDNVEQISKATQFLAKAALQATVEYRSNYGSSPFAASVMLALVTEGAEGDTKSELLAAFGISNNESLNNEAYKKLLTSIKELWDIKNIHFSLKNWLGLQNFFYVYKNESVHESFAQLAEEYYLAIVERSFRSDNEDQLFRLSNAFSTGLTWPTSMTWRRTSMSWDGNKIRAFGAAGQLALGYVPSVDCTAFKLPYKITGYSLLVLVPKTKSTLDDTLNNLPENMIDEIPKTLTMKPAFVKMPCFKYTIFSSLKSFLKETTKVNRVFTEAADLSNISPHKLYLDDMTETTDIEVCVDGAVSSFTSFSVLRPKRAMKEYIIVDKPFVYILYNENNNIIFVAGKVEQPKWDDIINDSMLYFKNYTNN